MRKIRTSVLFVLGFLAWVNGSLLLDNGAAIRPVRDAAGALVYQRPGRVLMERDYWADFTRTPFAYISLSIGAVLFGWCLVRWIRFVYQKFYATHHGVD